MKLAQAENTSVCWIISTVNTFCRTPNNNDIKRLLKLFYYNLSYRDHTLDRTTGDLLLDYINNGLQRNSNLILSRTIEEIYGVTRHFFRDINDLKECITGNTLIGIDSSYGHARSIIGVTGHCPSSLTTCKLKELVTIPASSSLFTDFLKYKNEESPLMLFKNFGPMCWSSFHYNKQKRYGSKEVLGAINITNINHNDEFMAKLISMKMGSIIPISYNI
jgi:hypothetical protein